MIEKLSIYPTEEYSIERAKINEIIDWINYAQANGIADENSQETDTTGRRKTVPEVPVSRPDVCNHNLVSSWNENNKEHRVVCCACSLKFTLKCWKVKE